MTQEGMDEMVTDEVLDGAEAEDVVDFEGDLEEARAQSFGSSVDRTAASLSASGVSAEQVARVAAQAAYDICDYFVIVTGINSRLVDSVVDEVEEKVAKVCGEHPFSIEGRDERAWILMDYGSVIVHVFTPEQREYYRLEKLWGDAPELELELV